MRATAVAIFLLAACGSSSPPANQPGPPGTWTCKQIVESCDSMCRTGLCLQTCSNQGDQNGGSLHAALIQCAAAHRCYDDRCTRALCSAQVDACISDTQIAIADSPGPMPPAPLHEDTHAEPAPPVAAAAPAITPAALAGTWTYGMSGDAKRGAFGTYQLGADGSFERTTNVETIEGRCTLEAFTIANGSWKLDGSTLVLSVKSVKVLVSDSCNVKNDHHEAPAKNERRVVRMSSDRELAITDDAGELQGYLKKTR